MKENDFFSVDSSPCDPNFTFKVTKAKHDKIQWECEMNEWNSAIGWRRLSLLLGVDVIEAVFVFNLNIRTRKGED